MAKAVTTARRGSVKALKAIDPIGGEGLRLTDKAVTRSGLDVFENLRKSEEEAKAAQGLQAEAIGRQRQRESLRLAEAASDVGKRRLLRQTGGRRSLIASR